MYICMYVCMCMRVEIMCHSLIQSYKMFTIVVCIALHMLRWLENICCDRESCTYTYLHPYVYG